MKFWILFYILNLLTGNFIVTIIILFVAYLIIDRMFFNFISGGILDPIKRRRRIKSLLFELRINPSNANSAMELGVLYFESKKYEKAIQQLDKAHERIDNSPRLHAYKGMSSMELGRDEEGKEELIRALEMDNSVIFGLPYIYLIRYELSSKKSDLETIDKLEKSLERFSNTENFYRLGKVYKKNGNKKKALEMFDLAIKDYSYVQKRLKRLHRKWAWLARINKLTTR
ncbi:MAG: tetratricopeptide repeat protein [Bacillota bacterium]|nr:tetratricopeptide repeat protein [Bacillota bacterium]